MLVSNIEGIELVKLYAITAEDIASDNILPILYVSIFTGIFRGLAFFIISIVSSMSGREYSIRDSPLYTALMILLCADRDMSSFLSVNNIFFS